MSARNEMTLREAMEADNVRGSSLVIREARITYPGNHTNFWLDVFTSKISKVWRSHINSDSSYDE